MEQSSKICPHCGTVMSHIHSANGDYFLCDICNNIIPIK